MMVGFLPPDAAKSVEFTFVLGSTEDSMQDKLLMNMAMLVTVAVWMMLKGHETLKDIDFADLTS